jgi:hypothetical protein
MMLVIDLLKRDILNIIYNILHLIAINFIWIVRFRDSNYFTFTSKITVLSALK